MVGKRNLPAVLPTPTLLGIRWTMLTPQSMTSVFLSYARDDDEPFVRRLFQDLVAGLGFQVWFDRASLLSRGLGFHQEIKDAIRTSVDRVVYVGGPKAATSPSFVRNGSSLSNATTSSSHRF